MTVCDLFAGIGGFSLGLERSGMTIKYQVEINEYCNRILAKHWPSVKRFQDIRTIGPDQIGPVDVVCGGFPCQPFSLAGERKGAKDDRHLWPEMLRIITALRPTWVIGENTPGIINMELDNVLADLEGAGYACQSFVIPACSIDAPHRRDRVWVVAHANGKRKQQPQGDQPESRGRLGNGSEDVPDARQPGLPLPEPQKLHREGRREEGGAAPEFCRWTPEPGMDRVAYGVPGRVDRLKALGNAVVPQVVEQIGRAIMSAHHQTH